MNRNQVHFSRIRASELLLLDANDPPDMEGPDAPDAPQIWDTRSDGEWDGSNDRGNARAGHVPGAKHLEWLRLMQGPPSRRFRPLDEIRELIAGAGIDPEAATVTY